SQQSDVQIPSTIGLVINDFKKINNISEIYYMITEYDPLYTPILEAQSYNNTTGFRAYVNIAVDLSMLNRGIGFVHWDLHTGNILFKKDKNGNICSKYYDFDLSDTCLTKLDVSYIN